MKHIQTYGEALKQLLSDYDLSISALCMRLQLSSRTLISRVINGTCRPDTVTGFHDKLTAAANTPPFTAEDYAALVAKMFAGEVTVSNDTETQPEVALTVTYYGNIK